MIRALASRAWTTFRHAASTDSAAVHLGRYPPRSGLVMLTLSSSVFDPLSGHAPIRLDVVPEEAAFLAPLPAGNSRRRSARVAARGPLDFAVAFRPVKRSPSATASIATRDNVPRRSREDASSSAGR